MQGSENRRSPSGGGFSYFSYSYLTRCFYHNTQSISHIHTGPSICCTHTELGISHTHTRQNIPHTHTGPSISHTLKKRYFSHSYWTKYFAYTHWRKNFSYKYWSLGPVSLTGIAVPRWRMAFSEAEPMKCCGLSQTFRSLEKPRSETLRSLL